MKLIRLLLPLIAIVGIASSAWAVPIFVGGYDALNDDYVTHPVFQDEDFNVNAVLLRYNEVNYPDLPGPLIIFQEVEAGNYGDSIRNPVFKPGETEEDEIIGGTLYFTPGIDYVSLKWDAHNGGFALYYVAGETFLTFAGLSHGLSHYREWNATEVPEPSAFLFLGASLILLFSFCPRKNV